MSLLETERAIVHEQEWGLFGKWQRNWSGLAKDTCEAEDRMGEEEAAFRVLVVDCS